MTGTELVRGTRLLIGDDAIDYSRAIEILKNIADFFGYEEIILPLLWQQDTFTNKAGEEILNKMYTFKDKGDRNICLIPEATAIIQEVFKSDWDKTLPKPIKVFYVTRCYRYDNPQQNRFREFTQFGMEILGPQTSESRKELEKISETILQTFGIKYQYQPSVKRGLSYYVGDGFEYECKELGSQKQIIGGGSYDCGIGFALGIERLIAACKCDNCSD